MIELDSLKFTVDTADLIKAVTEVGNLQKAVSQLNKPLAENAKISAKVAVENAKVAVAEEKVAKAKAQTETAEARLAAAKLNTEKAEVQKTTAQIRAEKATERLTAAVRQQVSVEKKQREIYEFQTQGYSKGQATILAQAKAQGALGDELQRIGEILKAQRRLVGGEPFDKSTSGLLSLVNAMSELKDAARTAAAGIQMTSKQYKDFARDKLRIIELSKAENWSYTELKEKLREHGAEYVKLATEVNRLTAAEKEREREQRLQLNAIRAIATEEEKMESILRSLNLAETEHVTVSEKAARSIANYERNLRLAGITGEQAAIKLDKFRKSAMMAAQAEEKRKVDMLSRALAPQISDVVVSLASGMNPLTVALQQGLQVRDLIGLSGVEVTKLKEAFNKAGSEMVSSLKGTAVALGSLLIGSIRDAGSAVLKFGGDITLVNPMIEKMRSSVDNLNLGLPILSKSLAAAGAALSFVTGSIVVLAIAAMASFALSIRSVIKEENELNKALILTGSIAGVSFENVSMFTSALSQQGIRARDTSNVITEMGKAGGFTSSQIEMVTKTAVKLNEVLDQDLSATVKQFSDIAKKPSESLIEWSAKTGLVDAATVKLVVSLEQAGKKTEAAAVAMKAYADASQSTADQVNNNYGYLTRLGIQLKEIWNDTWDAIMGWGRKADPTDRLKELQDKLSKFNPNESRLLVLADKKRTEDEIASILRDQINASNRAIDKVVEQNKNKAISSLNTLGVFGLNKADEIEETVKRIRKLGEEAGYTERDIKKMISVYRSKNKTPKSDAEKEAEKLRKSYLKDIERINDLLEDSKQKTEGLTESQRVLLDIKSSESWNKYTEAQKVEIQQMAEMAHLDELMAVAAKKRREQDEAALKAYIEVLKTRDDIMFDILAESDDLNQVLDDQTQELMLQNSMLGLTTEEQQKILKLKKLELQYQKEIRRAREIYDPSARAEAEDAALRRYKQAVLNVETEINIERSSTLINGLTDAIVTGLFEGGKAGSQKLRDVIEAELRKPITVFIKTVVGDIIGSGKSSSASGVLSNIGSLGSSLGSFGSFLSYGTNLGSQQSAMLAAQESGMGTLTGTLGSIGSIAGAFGTGMAASFTSMMSAGVSGWASAAGSLIGSGAASGIAAGLGMIAAPLAAAAVLWKPLFGRTLKDTGIQGTFSGTDQFAGNTYKFYKGGLLRSDETKKGKLDPVLQSALGQAYGGLTSSNIAMAGSLGIDAESLLSGFTSKIKFSTKGLKSDQIQKKIEEVLGKVSEEQAKKLLEGSEEFVRFGETAVEALGRMSSSLQSVNKFLDLTNGKLFDLSTQGGDTASSLVDLFGGTQNFEQIAGQYYQNFFTEEERLAKDRELLANAFKDLGMEVPATLAAYRGLVETTAKDLTTEEARQTFTSLMKLSEAFYEIDAASREATDTMIEEINRLRGVVQTTSTGGFEGTKASFLSAISAAGSGDANAMASLPGLSQSLESMFAGNARSLEDVTRFRSWLANSIGSVVPAFASGGIHTGGARLVGENGPELEVTGPSRIFSASETAGMLGGNNVVQAIAVLNQNLELLRAEVRADVQHNAKTAKLLDRVIPDGDSIKVSNL